MPETSINRNHATIHTATISVKVIRIDKKQVTLATFRQLDEESIFLADGTLRGVPWGRVSYTWQGCGKDTDFHVVWQDGDRLKRSAVPCKTYWAPDPVFGGREEVNTDWLDWVWDRDTVREFEQAPDGGQGWLELVRWCEKQAADLRQKLSSPFPSTVCLSNRNEHHDAYDSFVKEILEGAGCGTINVSSRDREACTLTCGRGDFPALIAYLDRAATPYRDRYQAAQLALRVWRERRKAAGDKFWAQVEAMRQLDQLFIAT
jgi:hypothetical protein